MRGKRTLSTEPGRHIRLRVLHICVWNFELSFRSPLGICFSYVLLEPSTVALKTILLAIFMFRGPSPRYLTKSFDLCCAIRILNKQTQLTKCPCRGFKETSSCKPLRCIVPHCVSLALILKTPRKKSSVLHLGWLFSLLTGVLILVFLPQLLYLVFYFLDVSRCFLFNWGWAQGCSASSFHSSRQCLFSLRLSLIHGLL